MIEISLFGEDFGHEEFLKALIERLAAESYVEVRIRARSVRGGRGKVLAELGQRVGTLDPSLGAAVAALRTGLKAPP